MKVFIVILLLFINCISSAKADVSIKLFGAKCDGVTDDTAKIQAAGDYAITIESRLYIDPSTDGCVVKQNGSNPYTLFWSSPIEIIGVPGSIIRPDNALGATVNIIYFGGSTNTYKRTIVDGIFIGDTSGSTRKGNHAIVFDTLSAGTGFYHPQIKNNYFQQSASGTGWSVFVINSQANNPTGGFVYPEFKDNLIGSGVALNKSGDSAHFIHNVFTGTSVNPGIYLDLVNGTGGNAGNTVIDGGNNFGTAAGAVIIDCAQATLIVNNEIEQSVTSTEANGTIIDIAGGTCTVDGTRILANQIQSITAAGTPTFIKVHTTTNTLIDQNKITTPTDFIPIIIDATSTGTLIGAENSFSGMTTTITNNGSGTRQVLSVAYGTTPLSTTKTVRASGGAADCTLIFTSGLLTGGSC